MSIGFGIERIGLGALRFPRMAAICVGLLFTLIVVSLPRLSFDDDIHRVFLSDSPVSQAQRAYDMAQHPPLSTIILLVTSPDPFTGIQMMSLRDLSLDLQFVDGVNNVASPFVLRFPPDAGAPSGRPVFGTDIGDDFVQDLAAFVALGTGLPTLVNDTTTAMLLTVSVNMDQTELAGALIGVRSEIENLSDTTLTVSVTGDDVISAEIVEGLKGDLIALNLWGAMIVTLAALILLRDLRMALLSVVPAIAGAAGVLGLSVWLGYPLTVLSNVVPILLLVLGVADGVHLAGHLKENRDARTSIQTVGPACALTALTTSVAFGSIMLVDNAQLFEFAVLGALGTMLSFSIVIVMFALLAGVLMPSDKPVPQVSARFARALAHWGAARPRVTTVGCALVLLFATLGFSQTRAWFPLYQNLPEGSPTVIINEQVANDFGGVFQMVIETEGDWDQIVALTDLLEAISGSHTVLSEVNLARWLGAADHRPTAADLEDLPAGVVDRLKSDEATSRIFVSVPEPMRDAQTLQAFDEIYQASTDAGAYRILGLPTIMRFEAISLIKQLSFGLVIAALGATAVIALAFRSGELIPVLLVPNILPLMVTGASLHLWVQGELSPTAVLALTIAFGIAIDDSVHFLNRFQVARSRGATLREAVDGAVKSAGQVMVLTTVLLTAGLCVTLTSDFTPIRLFGGMMILTLWAALLVDLILLPALLLRKETHDAID